MAAHPSNRFAQAFLVAQEAAGERALRGGLWALFEFWQDAVESPMKIVRGFIDPIVRKALEDKEKKGEKDVDAAEEHTLLDHLVTLTDGTCSHIYIFEDY